MIHRKHVLIVGQTMSGKSTLAKMLCAEYRRVGRKTVVLDPLLDEWQADLVLSDPEEFLTIATDKKRAWDCALFIDEGRFALSRDRRFDWLFTTSRHHLHTCHVISQRPAGLTPDVRLNAIRLFCFSVGKNDAKLLCDDFACEALLEAPTLGQGDFIFCERMSQEATCRLNVFSDLGDSERVTQPAPEADEEDCAGESVG